MQAEGGPGCPDPTERAGTDVSSGTLCTGTRFPLSFVLYSLRAECVVIWSRPPTGSAPGERALVPRQQTQGPLFERSILLLCVNGRKAGCPRVPAGAASLLKAHCIPRAIVLTHSNLSFSSFSMDFTEVSQRKDEKVARTWMP